MTYTTYTIDGKEFELRHFGVKGMKWGRRKARPQPTGIGRSRDPVDNSPEAQAARQEARRQKLKRAAKIGAAVAATALAVYGAKKLNAVIRDKNYQYRMREAKRHVDSYMNSTVLSSPNKAIADRRRMEFTRDVVDNYGRKASSDSFGTAVRNVTRDYLDRRRR